MAFLSAFRRARSRDGSARLLCLVLLAALPAMAAPLFLASALTMATLLRLVSWRGARGLSAAFLLAAVTAMLFSILVGRLVVLRQQHDARHRLGTIAERLEVGGERQSGIRQDEQQPKRRRREQAAVTFHKMLQRMNVPSD
ncbi:MAG TPA: hypothetical protein VHC00_15660 [Rhizobiaceae bacterium]|nr:hypothetical protein [Rhizobiaceae bacterium]